MQHVQLRREMKGQSLRNASIHQCISLSVAQKQHVAPERKCVPRVNTRQLWSPEELTQRCLIERDGKIAAAAPPGPEATEYSVMNERGRACKLIHGGSQSALDSLVSRRDRLIRHPH